MWYWVVSRIGGELVSRCGTELFHAWAVSEFLGVVLSCFTHGR